MIYKFLLLFVIGSVTGWVIEVFWRRYLGLARQWVNPGFLSGPWLPLYGSGAVVLYLICKLALPWYINAPFFFVVLSTLEFLVGLVTVHYFKIRLWDYRENRWNIIGLVCPLYSFFWMLLGILFDRLFYPELDRLTHSIQSHPEFSFFIGIYLGILMLDSWQSLNLALRIKNFVTNTDQKWHLDYEKLKLELSSKIHGKSHYFLPFYGELGSSLKDKLVQHHTNLTHRPKPLKGRLKR